MSDNRLLTIFHTNDFHDHLTPELGEDIRKARQAAGPDTILLDGGDAIGAGNVGVKLSGERALSIMSDAGYDAMAMGNREFHMADAVLRHKIANARFPVLSANLRYKDQRDAQLPTKPYVILTTGSGIKVAVMGLTVQMVTERMTARHLSAFVFDDPQKVALETAPRLRQMADVVVLISHVGYNFDMKLARICTDFDIIIGAHTHIVLENGDTSAGTPVVETGSFARYLGRADLAQSGGGRWTLQQASLMPLKVAK
ncbi:MAG TPA: metallophosphatase [Capsulimonadaceae bacterium]|jgi:2',3'-cyclic-nucleotide 2'-phosphodiesterase (5'-nucleotidase family)